MPLPVKPCKLCKSKYHTAWQCPSKPRSALLRGNSTLLAKKPMKRLGKEGRRYMEFRNDVAYPYLVERDGEQCSHCGRADVPLDVDHLHKRGSHPELKYDLNNLQLLCRRCHDRKDNQSA